ncbi:MAG: hypothetical protein MJ135_01330 [Oscillospiraceae bacterium]|nr:hypothetical protein [Oscillospiraceae bacterium]
MPPRTGGSSSHSSSSSSRSSSSSSRSSSSHSSSSYSSSRSSSSYSSSRSSSSSYGSSSRSSYSSRPSSHSSSSYSSGPSRHSSSSHSSRPASSGSNWNTSVGNSHNTGNTGRYDSSRYDTYAGRDRDYIPRPHQQFHTHSYVPPVIITQQQVQNDSSAVRSHRERVNQPPYYTDQIVPWICYCQLHDYLYFASPWTYGGSQYPAGYYDENGNWYAKVVMDDNNQAAPLEATCEYCGRTTIYAPSSSVSLDCQGCGAPLTISPVNEMHDTLIAKEPYHALGTQPGTPESRNYTYQPVNNKKKKHTGLKIAIFVAAVWFAVSNFILPKSVDDPLPSSVDAPAGYVEVVNQTNPDIFGSTLYLSLSDDGLYDLGSFSSSDRELYWLDEYESYYDEETDAYLWYNTDVDPALWQYWFEGISNDYGDYGWMECEGDTWWIQNADGEWEEYTGDTDGLWHIRNEFDY